MAFLREAGRSLASSLDPQEVLAVTLARVNEVLDVDAASLTLVDAETGHIIFALAIGGANDRIEGLQMEPGQSIVGHVIEEGRSHLIPDVSLTIFLTMPSSLARPAVRFTSAWTTSTACSF